MAASGKIKLDDLHSGLQQSFANDRLALSGGQTGFNGYGFNPYGNFYIIDNDDPTLVYSGDWYIERVGYPVAANGREGLNRKISGTPYAGDSVTVSFYGTALYMNTIEGLYGTKGISVSIDGGVTSTINLSATGVFGSYLKMADGLTQGYHTVKITNLYNNLSVTSSTKLWIYHFAAVAQAVEYDKVTLAPDKLWGKSSAFVGSNRVDALTSLTKSIPEIVNLIPNASFERIAPVWGAVFQDNFDRPNGAVGNGWTTYYGTGQAINTNMLSLAANSNMINGDNTWLDRQVRFSFVAGATTTYVYIKHKNDINRIIGAIGTGTTNNVYLHKIINGITTTNLNPISITITAGTTYYISAKSQGNIYTLSVYSDIAFATLIGTTTLYNDEVSNGQVGLEVSGNAVNFNNFVVTAPIPDGWEVSSDGITSINNNIVKHATYLNVMSYLSFESPTPQNNKNIPVVVGQQYTYAIKRKLSSYSGGGLNGVNLVMLWIDSTGNGVLSATTSVVSRTIDTDFVLISLTATAPANSAYVIPYARLMDIGVCEFKEPILVTGPTAPVWHTKESRCDLVSLQNDGQVIVTQGNGASELGYRVEAENGLISNWYRDKGTVSHWDRAKTWKSGAWVNTLDTGDSNNAHLVTSTSGDVFYISFVGTGIDLVLIQAYNVAIIGVTVDAGTEYTIDCYNPNVVYKTRVPLARNLPYGQHTIKLRNTGTKNTLSNNISLYIDAFDIYVPAIPSNPSPTTLLPVSAVIKADPDYGWIRYEDNEGVLYSGTWAVSSGSPTFSGGSENENSGTGSDYADFSFIGSGIRWIGSRVTVNGIAQVLIDNVSIGNYDTYNATNLWGGNVNFSQNTNFGLHTIRIKATNTKNASSTNYGIQVDAFDIKNTMYVIDLRKNQSQTLVEQKIVEHEAKDLWDAHPQAIKGDINKLRIEKGRATINTTTNAVSSYTLTFGKAFTVPPIVIPANESPTPDYYGKMSTYNITTTGCIIYIHSTFTSNGSSTFDFIVIGY